MFVADLLGGDLVVVIVVVVVLIFGGTAIPKFARNLGSAKTEFEKGLKAGKSGDAANPSSDVNDPKPPDTTA